MSLSIMSIHENFCDNCKEMIILLSKYDDDDDNFQTFESLDSNNFLDRDALNLLINYMNNWSTKHCACCYKDQKNFQRFDNLVQSIIIESFEFLNTVIIIDNNKSSENENIQSFFDDWNDEDKERLLLLLSKVFQLSFPLYVTYKHSNYTKNDELSPKELKILANYCDLSDYEMPIYLMRKIIYFIEHSGFKLFIDCFSKSDPNYLTISLANSLISTIQSLKYYFTLPSINNELVTLRIEVINYLCKIGDNDLRNLNNRGMFEFIWSVIKEYNFNNNFGLDYDGLKIAHKYFLSSTLTMRLSGLAQINNCIAIYNDLTHPAMNTNLENIRNGLSQWLIDNKILENIYGPNSHVEVIKQSHFILNFLANRLTTEHLDLIWCAAQLKHYERYVIDLLCQLIKNLKIQIVYHLYNHLWKIKPKDHSEHTLNLASHVIKYIWLFNGIQPDMLTNCSYLSNDKIMIGFDENILNKNSLMSSLFKERTNNSSSASSIEVSDEDEEDEFDVNLNSPRLIEHHMDKTATTTTTISPLDNVDDDDDVDDDDEDGDDDGSNQSSNSDGSDMEIQPQENHIDLQKNNNDDFKLNDLDCQIQLKEYNDDDPPLSSSSSAIQWNAGKTTMNPCDDNGNDNGKMMEIDLDLLDEDTVKNKQQQQQQDFQFRISDVHKPGNTLLYDILQDDILNLLNEDLANAVEKIFWNLLCCASDREIRFKFIAGCLENLSKNYSVITSLRLLQKLFSSFYQYQDGKLIRKIILTCEKEKNMLKLFFNNLSLFMYHYKYSNDNDGHDEDQFQRKWLMLKSKFYTPKEEIQIRLNFLSFIFINAGSHEILNFSQEHVNILWNVFTKCESNEIVDEFFDWLLNQVKLNNGLNIDIIKHILFEKMPFLKPESFSLISLDLLQNLHGFILSKNCENPKTFSIVVKLLWDIAFKNPNQNVSMNASRHLNNYYINLLSCTNRFDKEEEFIRSCIGYLKDASILLPISCQRSLLIIERAVILLKTYLEIFYARYSYFFRTLKLSSKFDLSMHRIPDKSESMINIMVCSPFNDRNTFEFSLFDYIGDLRAEVQHWWRMLRKSIEPVAMDDQLICLVLNDHEISFDCDEKRLLELNFKDNQINQISFHICKHTLVKSSNIVTLSLSSEFFEEFKQKNPKNLLIEPNNFELLFILMQQLDMINVNNLKARILSRNIWEIVQMLPTPYEMVRKFHQLESKYYAGDDKEKFPTITDEEISPIIDYNDFYKEIFPSNSNQKLIYSCQLIENYRKINKDWPRIFMETGGLRFFYRTFIDVVCTLKMKRDWTEWKQDCLTSLIQILYQFTKFSSKMDSNDQIFKSELDKPSDQTSIETRKNKRLRKNSLEKNSLMKFSQEILAIIEDEEKLLDSFMIILNNVFMNSKPIYQTSIWSRSQVVYIALTFFTSWLYSDPNIFEMFLESKNAREIIKKLLIDDVDHMVRKESNNSFSRVFLSLNPELCRKFLPKFLKILLNFLEEASLVNIQRISSRFTLDDKENYYPGNKDYFLLVCRLIDHLYSQKSTNNINSKDTDLDAENLSKQVANLIVNRENFESNKNHHSEDEGLKGLFLLQTVLLKNNPQVKCCQEMKEFIMKIFDCLFSLPTFNHRQLPKCKNIHTRKTAFDLLLELIKGNEDNYVILTNLLIDQHRHEIIGRQTPYPWEYWPQDESRSDFVGLTNLGATCYMASCMQHLFMLPEARNTILTCNLSTVIKHESILRELQKMFIFLQESERKSYNPKNFCKVYTMDHQPLNICEQKDMTEFFTDLITKLEEMTADLKDMVKKLFSGLQSNNVVSLDCPHISQTMEEFYTLRCQVADMRDLYESLNELTVKDTLDGDNMYNCSVCGRKVRAEKRACIKKLPKILCFNTMRYTFNMITMTKEKVNTHFSFPFTLDMSPYLEKNLLNLPDEKQFDNDDDEILMMTDEEESNNSTKYDLIGVTVHTGTAEGGHYYCFIQDRDPQSPTRNKWFLFNDAEVKLFDKSQIATECFGGEMTSKTYDKINDKFLDFSFEKTNSAYMLFYEKCDDRNSTTTMISTPTTTTSTTIASPTTTSPIMTFENLSKELIDWIWSDNLSFVRDKLIFEHTYFDFIWKVVTQTPYTFTTGIITTTTTLSNKSTLISIRLATLFVLETLIHSKEKPTIPNWIELLIKQFNNSKKACEWIMNHLAENDWWSMKILFKCSNQTVRQIFVRLCIHVIQKLKSSSSIYMHSLTTTTTATNVALSSNEDLVIRPSSVDLHLNHSVINFIKRLISLINSDLIMSRPNIKYLSEYFSFLLEFAKQGDEEYQLLLSIGTISTLINFYLNHGKIVGDFPESFQSSDNEDEDFDERSTQQQTFRPILDEKFPRIASLDKMLSLIVYLLEKSQNRTSSSHQFIITKQDFDSLISEKTFQFLQQQIRDNINLRQTFNLICSICNIDDSLFSPIINMIFSSIIQFPETSQMFFKILSFITESAWVSAYFSKLILPRIWDLAEPTTLQTLEWLIQHVPRNKILHDHVLNTMDHWVLYFLIENSIQRVRSSTAQLLISLVPSMDDSFRQNYRPFRSFPYTINKEILLNKESLAIIDQLFSYLLGLIKKIKILTETQQQQNQQQKLTNYFYVLTYLMINTKQKRLFITYFNDFWILFQTKLSEPAIPIHQNKQAFLMFLYVSCNECKDSIKLIVQNANVYKKIALNYILADHDDQEVVMFNKNMLPYYYGLLRVCCEYSRSFTRYLALQQNIQWAFKNITPYSNHYSLAINELFKLIRLFTTVYSDSNEQEINEAINFKQMTLKLYLHTLDPDVHWNTIIAVLNILIETNDDLLFIIRNNGLCTLFQSFSSLHVMFHQATACHITAELIDLLKIISSLLSTFEREFDSLQDYKTNLKAFLDIKKFIFLLNTYTPSNLRQALFEVLFKLIKVFPYDYLVCIVKFLLFQHNIFVEQNFPFISGPYFPKRGQKSFQTKSSLRPARPTFQMCFNITNIDNHHHNHNNDIDRDFDYDRMVFEFYRPYYTFIDDVCRFAMKKDLIFEELVDLTVKLALESLYFRNKCFIILWLDSCENQNNDNNDDNDGDNGGYNSHSIMDFLSTNNSFFDYMKIILLKEKSWLEDDVVYRFFKIFLPKTSLSYTANVIKQNILPSIENLSRNPNLKNLEIVQQLIWNLLTIKVFIESNSIINQDLPENFSTILNNLKKLYSPLETNEHCESEKTDHEENNSQESKKPKLMSNVKIDESSTSKLICDSNRQSSSSSSYFIENMTMTDSMTQKNFINKLMTLIHDICELLNNC
uniref:ubiquitinyl hydrolase 1 n=1 Tax=Dermatophagoides pteronyssinus TaxID=6956 RepID=A0A6P6Y3P7_DERPT|nr:ubiquitin carboxyl-terminal hydrolase 34-like [Dermatophagoides pteronyssinus]